MEKETSYRKNLIIEADDFGLNQLANEKILELARSGKIDRVAVLADEGGLSASDIAELKIMGVKLDIHLDAPAGK